MHTLLIHQAFASHNDSGGARHFELARRCIEQGDAFTIVGSDLSYHSGKRISVGRHLVTEENLEGVCVLRAFTYASLHRSFIGRMKSYLSFMVTSIWAGLRVGQVDLIMGTSPPIFQAISAWVLSVLRWRPFLLEIRDLWPAFAIDMGVLTNRFLITLSRFLERFLYHRATHILVNSPAYRDYVIGQGIPAAKITLIANGVRPEMFDPVARGDRFRQELGLNGKFVVTYAGALGPANDIYTVLRAAARLKNQPQIRFLFIGGGKERQKLEEDARGLGLPNVSFHDPRPRTEMPEVLAASDACIAILKNIPMFTTTYPNKVFDYMAAGRPTVLVIDGVIRKVIESAKGGIYVPPGDDAALASAVETLSRSPEIGKQMGLSARAYVAENFNRNDQAEQFVKVLRNVAAARTE